MKLIIAIVQDEDASRLVNQLMKAGIGVTKLATTGGFLLIGVDDAKLQGTLDIIEKVCKSRKQMAASPTPMGGASNVYTSFPMEVTVGGATVFVLTVDQFMKL